MLSNTSIDDQITSSLDALNAGAVIFRIGRSRASNWAATSISIRMPAAAHKVAPRIRGLVGSILLTILYRNIVDKMRPNK